MDAVPEDLRCKRSDGKQWRCSAPSMPDKTVCEKHYVQAKKRAASSALRATLRRSSPSYAAASYAPPREGDADADLPLPMAVARPFYGSVVGEPVYVAEPAVRRGLPLINAIGSRTAAELVGRASVGLQGCAEVKTSCHQCRRSVSAVWCTSCDRRGYCGGCISRWYSDIAIDDIQKVCPACRGICNCKVCLQGDNVIKARVQEISVVDKLKYLHSILAYVLPVLKQIYSDQCFEIGVETRAYGPKMDIIRAKMNSDEQMCCDFCKVPVFDYHRHCPRCLYDLCLDCCRDIRRSQTNVVRGEYAESKGPVVETNKDSASDRARLEPSAASVNDKLFPEPIDANDIGIRSLFPTWRANNDGSITCGPHEAGGCGSSKLVLRRIFKINWIGKLVKSSQEMVNGCKAHDLENGCSSCHDSRRLDSIGRHNFGLSKCSDSDGIDGNSVYSSVLENLKYEGIVHFRKHWINGEPVIIRNAFEPSLSSSWDPLSIWRGIQEIMDEKMDENAIVKAVDCSNQSEVHIKLNQFIKGYSDGHKGEDGKLIMLKLKDWPPVSVLEEFLLCQRPEFIVNFPLVDFIHSKWGFLNLAAKLPPDALQSEVGLKLLIAYGRQQQPGKSDSVTNLMVKMGDVVHMLMHRAEMRYLCPKSLQPEQPERIANGMAVHVNAHAPVQNLNLDMGEQSPEHTVSKSCGPSAGSSAELSSSSHSEQAKTNGVERSQPGALWDVFRRQDVPMLNKYLASNWEELTNNSQAMLSVKHPIYDQAVYLREHHKRVLKDQYGIEPRTFEQHIGEAVFIPAGCPYQVKNLQSTVQLALDFLSPESLRESARMAQEIRCLPNHHDAKLKMLEVGKIALYAASSAVKEIQKITLDPKFNLDIRFEDQNLTRAVSENLARVTKQRKVSCG
ncbi:hypothetical protein CFC21_052194 [Triticum aestivum]|uniref:Lysine-specific demethylase JMJ25 n=3 Tax=Triticum TaxID=4564 RepID=A0A9R0VX54_TRITD|nr:lysine-specific demethylase JMJ25-like isoform X2 [Triticum dicoccoides]XP_044363484.1 lysine-specific demethylase JMJ25-like isoform X2 [Triticum aestivum]KAF7042652.1 hypothetical protein CFC21_052194 [Triticum aestivum]VAH90827.1 unnamed protein product [Triticum turgidum subsp. durum]